MKRFFTVFLLCLIITGLYAGEQKMVQRYNRLTNTWAAYPEVTIREIQERPLDSLTLADALQNRYPSRWNLQTSPLMGQTVVVTALVVVPPKIITYTAMGKTMLLYDTAAANEWRGVFLRSSADSATIAADGFFNVVRGNIIRITGTISEFPTNGMNSGTQFAPVAGIKIDVIGSMPIPPPVKKNVGDFYTGIFSGGSVWYSTGELMEGMIVELTNLTVDVRVNTDRGTFSIVDAIGNQITDYDASRYFTFGSSTDHPFGRDPVWNIDYPPIGAKIDTLRGFITVASGGEAARGYRICPLYYGDIVFGIVLPSVTTHRRYPIVVPPDSTPLVTCRAVAQADGATLTSVVLYYSVDNGSFTPVTMVLEPSDTTYRATIPQQVENSFVKYFIKATDDQANEKILASSAFGGATSDTSKGFFFYNVLNRPLTIYDIQHTPFLNGRTPYLGAVVTISGIVTADSSSISVTRGKNGWTTAWYMQSSNQPWNGIWMVGPESTMAVIRNGDDVTVTGSVDEDYDVTRIQNISSVVVNSIGHTVPEPADLLTGTFGSTVGNGAPAAEQWEGMIVRFSELTITSIDPTFADNTEYEVDDGSGPMIVQQGGKNIYSNRPVDTTVGKTILYKGNTISYLTGIMYFSYNRYKFVPRTNADFGTIGGTGVSEQQGGILPARFGLSQNYPNPFNPLTKFEVNLPHASYLEVTVYNLLGQKVATLINEQRPAGSYTINWDGTAQSGLQVNSGVYFVRMQADNFTSVRKIMLLK